MSSVFNFVSVCVSACVLDFFSFFWVQATGHSFSLRNVIFRLRWPCTIRNQWPLVFLKISFFMVKGGKCALLWWLRYPYMDISWIILCGFVCVHAPLIQSWHVAYSFSVFTSIKMHHIFIFQNGWPKIQRCCSEKTRETWYSWYSWGPGGFPEIVRTKRPCPVTKELPCYEQWCYYSMLSFSFGAELAEEIQY